jgi:hypothetical protein
MSYTLRYAAFIDILGFKEIVRKSVNNEQMVQELVKSLHAMGERNPHLEKVLGEDFRAHTFSDTILMSEKATASGLSHLLYQVQELALNLLRSGLLIRGGIAKGLLYHEESVVFGPAFLEAYRLESNVASFPRVVLNKDVFEDVQKYREVDDRWKEDFDADLRFSEDGPVHVHLLKRFGQLNREPRSEEFLHSEEVLQAQFCQRTLQSLIDDSMHEPRHFEKLKWFAIYWNGTCMSGKDAPLGAVSFPYMPRRD